MSTIRNFPRAGQAEILRAAQKDEQITDKLGDLVSDLTYTLGGNRRWLKSRQWRETLGNVLYYGVTTLAGFQTLGEEYTGIIQIDKQSKNIPGKFIRLSLVGLSCGGELLLLDLFKKLEDYFKLPSNVTHLRPEAQTKLLLYISIFKLLIPYLHRLHKGVFYLNGNYYHIAKRLTGVKYILVRHWLKAETSHRGFKILGGVSLLYLVLLSLHTGFKLWKNQHSSKSQLTLQDVEMKTSTGSGSKLRCALCLEDRKNTALTPCGHLFCWICILEWVQAQQMCPLCREKVLPSRIVLLQNYETIQTSHQIF